jgi:hypothetical protein
MRTVVKEMPVSDPHGEADRAYWSSLADEAREDEVIGMMRDKVTLVKKDGTVFRCDIPAAVSTGQITTFAKDLPIEVGDHFMRKLPSGLVDDYIVSDPGYHSGIAGAIQPHYQVKVRRSDASAATPQTIIASVIGENARVNIHTTDNSSNTVLRYSARDLVVLANELERLRQTLAPLAKEPEQYVAIGALASAELAARENDSSKVDRFLSSLGSAGKWVFETAKEVGVSVVAEIIQKSIGI